MVERVLGRNPNKPQPRIDRWADKHLRHRNGIENFHDLPATPPGISLANRGSSDRYSMDTYGIRRMLVMSKTRDKDTHDTLRANDIDVFDRVDRGSLTIYENIPISARPAIRSYEIPSLVECDEETFDQNKWQLFKIGEYIGSVYFKSRIIPREKPLQALAVVEEHDYIERPRVLLVPTPPYEWAHESDPRFAKHYFLEKLRDELERANFYDAEARPYSDTERQEQLILSARYGWEESETSV